MGHDFMASLIREGVYGARDIIKAMRCAQSLSRGPRKSNIMVKRDF